MLNALLTARLSRGLHKHVAKATKQVTTRLAVVAACYNRKATTVRSLSALDQQTVRASARLDVFLLDDRSPDGTAGAVRAAFPAVHVLEGTGGLFWSGGMRLAFGEALKRDYDFYVWLNDDTILMPDALERLVKAYQTLRTSGRPNSIIVASVGDPHSGQVTYGGARRTSRIHPFKYALIQPADEPRECDVMNGNCVLIPRPVASLVGNMSSHYTHAISDHDYALRARRLGCSVWVAPGYFGTCSRNTAVGSREDAPLPLRKRWKQVCGPKGLPLRDWYHFSREHGGPLWPVFWLMPYARLLFTSLVAGLRQVLARDRC